MNTTASADANSTRVEFADEYDAKMQRREGEILQPGAPPPTLYSVITQRQQWCVLATLLVLSTPVWAIMVYAPTSLDIHSRWGMLGYGALCVVGVCLALIYHVLVVEREDILKDGNKSKTYLFRLLVTMAVIEVATCVSLASSMYG